MPSPRSAALAVVGVALWMVSPVAEADGNPSSGDAVAQLRRQAAAARSLLEADARKLDEQRTALGEVQGRLRTTLRDLGQAQVDYERIRRPLAGLLNSAYKSGVTGLSSVLVGGNGGLAVAADLSFLADSRKRLVNEAGRLRALKEKLVAVAGDQQAQIQVAQTGLSRQITQARAQSDAITKRLTDALAGLGRDQRLSASCDPLLVSDARKFPNGLIPGQYLCPLPQPGRMLRADAALAFYRLNAAYRQRFGTDMCLRDSYRSLGDQQRIYRARPGFAAVPGRSNHGLGTAVDICGGVESQGSTQFEWMVANSAKYGWFHPAWAYSSPFEPWHWEYGRKASDPTPDQEH